jgi:uncharacterized protein (TIGR03545 family)
MMRFIRWQGAVAFVGIITLFVAFIYLFADDLIHQGLEKSGEWYLGAEVNVENVDVTYLPLTLVIENFQATDPEKPTHNLFSFSKAVAGVDIWQYLFGKIYISELNVDQLQLDVKRKSVGEVFTDEDSPNIGNKEEKGAFSAALPKLDASLPKVDELLKNSDLLTIKASKVLENSYKTETDKLKKLQKNLPNKTTLAHYKKQLKALSGTKIKSLADIEKLNQDFQKIKAQFKADKLAIKKAKKQLTTSKKLLTKQVTHLKEAPTQDWSNIESKYQLDKVEGADFAHILFGEQAREYYGYAETAYQKISPLLSKGNDDLTTEKSTDNLGRFVYFVEDNPLPSVLIAQANFSILLPEGELSIEGKELTHQHWIRGNKSELTVVSNNLQGSGKLNLALNFSLTEDNIVSSEGNWQLSELPLTNVELQDSSAFSLSLTSGLLAGEGVYSLLSEQMASENNFTIGQTVYDGKAHSKISELFVDTIKDLKSLALKIKATGSIYQPELSISSPLDKQLKNSMQQQVSKKLVAFKSKVKAGLNDKLTKALGISNQGEKSLLDVESLLNDTDGALNNLLSSDVVKAKKKEFADKQKKKLEDKVKKKLGKLFG